MNNNIFKLLGKSMAIAVNQFVNFNSAIKTAENIENSKDALMALGVSYNDSTEIIEECKNYSYTLPIPNHEGFMKRFLFIQDKIRAGENWVDIKKDLKNER